jgi:hypothetical protein
MLRGYGFRCLAIVPEQASDDSEGGGAELRRAVERLETDVRRRGVDSKTSKG